MSIEQGSKLSREVSVPDEYRDALASGEIAQIVRVGVITARGYPELLQPMHCTNPQHGPMQYTFEPYTRLSKGCLLLVDGVWAFRCATDGCPTSDIILPGVRAELRQKIEAAVPQEVRIDEGPISHTEQGGSNGT